MGSFTYRMGAGIPGDITRKQNVAVEALPFDATNPPTEYGVPVVVDATSKSIRKVLGGDLTDVIFGFLVRPYPVSNPNTTDGLGTSTPNTTLPANVLRRGYLNVKVNAGTAAKEGKVYVRTANPSAGKPVGGVEATQEWGAASAVKASGANTGNGTFVLDGTTPVLANAVPGVYTLRNIEAVTNGGKFQLLDPTGKSLGTYIIVAGAGGTITISDQIKGVLTDGSTDFVVGDGFDITVTPNTLEINGAKFTGAADSSGNTEVNYRM